MQSINHTQKLLEICSLLSLDHYLDTKTNTLSIFSEQFVIDYSPHLEKKNIQQKKNIQLTMVDEEMQAKTKYIEGYFNACIEKLDYALLFYFMRHFSKFFNREKLPLLNNTCITPENILLGDLLYSSEVYTDNFLDGIEYKSIGDFNIFTGKKFNEKVERFENFGDFKIENGKFYEKKNKNNLKSLFVKFKFSVDEILNLKM